MKLAAAQGLPIVIHSGEAMRDTLDMPGSRADIGLFGILHCFTGTLADDIEVVDGEPKLGIGGVVNYKKAGLAEVIAEVDLEHLVLETDAPYLSPVPFRGKRNDRSYIRFVAEKIAMIKKASVTEVARITTANAKTFSAVFKTTTTIVIMAVSLMQIFLAWRIEYYPEIRLQ